MNYKILSTIISPWVIEASLKRPKPIARFNTLWDLQAAGFTRNSQGIELITEKLIYPHDTLIWKEKIRTYYLLLDKPN